MTLILQRRLTHDSAHWRTVVRFQPARIDVVAEAARQLHNAASEDSDWRIVSNARPYDVLGRFSGDEWQLHESLAAPG